jgi:hypothetical protein
MSISCLVADDQKSADLLVSQIVGIGSPTHYIGIALYPDAALSFEKHGLQCVLLDDYINGAEESERGVEASNFIFGLNEKLVVGSSNNALFSFEDFNVLHSMHYINYYIFSSIFYYITTLQKVLRDINPAKVFAVDLTLPISFPIDPRPRCLLTKTLIRVCEAEDIPVKLIERVDTQSEDTIRGLSATKYIYRNSILASSLKRLLKGGLYNQTIMRMLSRYIKTGSSRGERIKRPLEKAILFVGRMKYFEEIVKRLKKPSMVNICLDDVDSPRGYFVSKGNLIFTNYRHLVDEYLSTTDHESISEFGIMCESALGALTNDHELRRWFSFKGVCFFDIFLQYLKTYSNTCFLQNLKFYIATKNFAEVFGIRFALAYSGWTTPIHVSIHEALKAKGVRTAYYSHGLNIVNAEIADSIRGDGTLIPCDVFFAPGQKFLKGYTENGFKNGQYNYVTGFPYYKKASRKKGFQRERMARRLKLDYRKRIVLYPMTYKCPYLSRPHMVSLTAEYRFLKKIIAVFRKYDQFQLVVKAKHLTVPVTVPDQSYLSLFNENYPRVALRYGDLGQYLSVSDVVVNFASSSGFDALLAGVPVIYFKPYKHHDWFEQYASVNGEPNYFLKANTYDDIPKLCGEIINDDHPRWYNAKMVEATEAFMPYTGDTSANRIVKVITQLSGLV